MLYTANLAFRRTKGSPSGLVPSHASGTFPPARHSTKVRPQLPLSTSCGASSSIAIDISIYIYVYVFCFLLLFLFGANC